MSDLQAIALCIALGSLGQAIGVLILAREIRALVETAKAEGGSEVAALRDLQASLDRFKRAATKAPQDAG